MRPQSASRDGHERQPEAQHRAEHGAIEVAPQHLAPVDDDHEQGDRGARVAAGDEPERLVGELHDEHGGEDDRHRDVDDRDRQVARRALLDAVEADRRLVHEADPEPRAREQPERLLAGPEQVRRRDRGGERRDRGHHEARDRRRGERGADDRRARLALTLEREAEEGVDQAELGDRHPDRDERRQRLDPAVVAGLQVVRVQRQQEQRREARDHRPEPVHERLPAEAEQAACGARRRGRLLAAMSTAARPTRPARSSGARAAMAARARSWPRARRARSRRGRGAPPGTAG